METDIISTLPELGEPLSEDIMQTILNTKQEQQQQQQQQWLWLKLSIFINWQQKINESYFENTPLVTTSALITNNTCEKNYNSIQKAVGEVRGEIEWLTDMTRSMSSIMSWHYWTWQCACRSYYVMTNSLNQNTDSG